MEPITLITGALGILKATGLTDWIGKKLGGDVGANVANTVVDIASAATGETNPESILAKLNEDKALSAQLKQKLMDNKFLLEQAYLQDVQSARQMYANTDHQVSDELAKKVMSRNMPFILLLVLLDIASVYFIDNTAMISLISGVIGGCISYLWNERQMILGFYFGSSAGSKAKDATNAGALKQIQASLTSIIPLK